MTAIHETAYPRIRSNLNDPELQELYTPRVDDLLFVRRVTKSSVTELGLVLLLKSFQRLGYFPNFDALPPRLIHQMREHLVHARWLQSLNTVPQAWMGFPNPSNLALPTRPGP
jgi:hypothetical protein